MRTHSVVAVASLCIASLFLLSWGGDNGFPSDHAAEHLAAPARRLLSADRPVSQKKVMSDWTKPPRTHRGRGAMTKQVRLIKWAEAHGMPKALANNPKDAQKVCNVLNIYIPARAQSFTTLQCGKDPCDALFCNCLPQNSH